MKTALRKLLQKMRLKKVSKYGEDIWIGKKSVLQGNIELGSHISIGSGAQFVSTKAKIFIHDYVVIAPNVTIYTGDHVTNMTGKHIYEIDSCTKTEWGGGVWDKDVTIEAGCWIGTRAIILKGVTVGRGSIIGAGAIVTKDIPPYSIYVGVPPCKVYERFSSEQIAEHERALRERGVSIY